MIPQGNLVLRANLRSGVRAEKKFLSESDAICANDQNSCAWLICDFLLAVL